MIWNVIGIVAGVISIVAMVPQIVVIHERQSACDISHAFLYGNLVVQMLWLTYSIGNKLWINALFAAGFATMVVYMMVVKKQYDAGNACNT